METTQSATDTAKATRMSRALLDEGYDLNYVQNVLQEKGFTETQIQEILRRGKSEVLERKLKTNRNVLLVIGFLWITGCAVYFLSDHTTTAVDRATGETVTTNEPGWLALRYFVTLGILTFVTVVRHIYLFVKSAGTEPQQSQTAPQHVTRTHSRARRR